LALLLVNTRSSAVARDASNQKIHDTNVV